MVYSIGLTGGIASGKSTVAALFSALGVDVISADSIARGLSAKNTEAYHQIVAHFGASILLQNGELDRRKLRDIIFADPDERLWLEGVLHPLIRRTLKEQVALSTSPYCIVEIPLLISKKEYPYLDKILVVTAAEAVQIDRVMTRDHCSGEQARAVLAAQPDLELRLNNADDVIINDADLVELESAVLQLHNKYSALLA